MSPDLMIQINVNGEKKECPAGTSVSELLESLDIDKRYVAVEVNLKVVPRTQLSEMKLQESDSLEIVTFVGGG
jgi:thiamine biosynthesis protein ThiS